MFYWGCFLITSLRVLCIFWITVFDQMCLLQIFSLSVACLLILLILSFAEQTFLILIMSSVWIIYFTDHVFFVISKKSFPYSMSDHLGFLVCYLPGMLLFMFGSMIHFELIFVNGVRSVSRFIFCLWMSSCFSTICWKNYPCSFIVTLLLCQRSVNYT